MAKNQFNIYAISDPHIGHDDFNGKGGIIRHANRPFKTMIEMTEVIKTRWNRVVRPQDVIIILGDFIWTGGAADLIKEYIKLFNGRMILVMGNHDKKGYSWYMNNGVQFVCDRFAWEFNGKRILFIHDPANVSSEELQKYNYIIHGHHHQNSPLVYTHKGVTHVNLSVENLKYEPINLVTLLSKLTQGYYTRNKR